MPSRILSAETLTDDVLVKMCCLMEVVNQIETAADKKRLPEERRWCLYRATHIKKYITARFPVIKDEIERGIYDCETFC
jgi:ribosomal protein S19E (S16A)